ncbi:MAG: hypothetical protein IKT10_03570 [Clostridiales bacterium]|nr:hypothetical protein [Clostridiales bacterium]
MTILEPYIPKEYLALKINYCKQRLAELPEVVVTQRSVRGVKKTVLVNNSHIYSFETKIGQELFACFKMREQLLSDLTKYEGLWYSTYRSVPPEDLKPAQKIRKIYLSDSESAVMNSKFFESLKHDSNPFYPEHKTCFYNGTYYRSAAEADIARFYTEQNIPFKYEPEIWLRGLNRPIYTDFVILIKELNQCKFHEHFGIKYSVDYTRKTATTYNNYSGAGLLPGLDLLCTYDTPDVPFDIRSLHTKLNTVIYNSLFALDANS